MTNSQLSWGRYPYHSQHLNAVCWPEDIVGQMSRMPKTIGETTLAFGMGRSYGDSCLAVSNSVLSMRGMNHILAADWEQGIITVHAGITLDELIQVILPRGWFLPVTPGTRFVTVGGAVANDVHGKNHHTKGTFGCHVKAIELFRSEEGQVICSLAERQNLFAATVGGLGLTGIILSVELQLRRIESNQIQKHSIKFNNLNEFFDLSNEFDSKYEYSVAWIDCLATGKNIGRGHYILGDHASEGALEPAKSSSLAMPFDPPFSFVNNVSLKAFNTIYYHRQRHKTTKHLVNYVPFFYPLDRILQWNKMYGRKGFQQYQCVVPKDQSREVLRELLQAIAISGMGSFLAVLKQFGELQSPGLLSFPMSGTTLALDFPQREPEISKLFATLDQLVQEADGRIYPAKDANMSPTHFKQSYTDWQHVEALRDPQLQSRFWQRVTN